MADQWRAAKVADVQQGDRIRTADGTELIVSRVESPFFGMDTMVAFIEDTPERWFKRPMPLDAEVEIAG